MDFKCCHDCDLLHNQKQECCCVCEGILYETNDQTLEYSKCDLCTDSDQIQMA